MNALLTAVSVALILTAVAGGVVLARRWVWRPLIAQRVVVQLDSGQAVSGLLLERRGPLLILGDAHVHTPGEAALKADGRSVIERARVLWVQVV